MLKRRRFFLSNIFEINVFTHPAYISAGLLLVLIVFKFLPKFQGNVGGLWRILVMTFSRRADRR